jgi:hypothetical protein
MSTRLTRLEQELAAARNVNAATSEHNRMAQAAVAAAMTEAAERVEGVAKKLNQSAGGTGIALG